MTEDMLRRDALLRLLGILCLSVAATLSTSEIFYNPEKVAHWLERSAAIVVGAGGAPDQYRYLPAFLVVMAGKVIGFKAAMLLCHFVFLFVFFYLMAFVAWAERPWSERAAICVVVAFIYPLSLFEGDRYDTSLYMAFMLIGLCLWQRPVVFLAFVVVYSAARADYALILALFVLVQAWEYERKGLILYLLACVVPVAAQCLLWVVFVENSYYTKIVRVRNNLSGEVFGLPGVWFTLGVGAFVLAGLGLDNWRQWLPPTSTPRQRMALAGKLAAIALYCGLLFVLARIREWRLVLPLVHLAYATLFGPAVRSLITPPSRQPARPL